MTNGTTYYYVVTATGAGGTSFASNEASATPVTAPVTVNLDYHGGSTILMNGTASNSAADQGQRQPRGTAGLRRNQRRGRGREFLERGIGWHCGAF